MSSPDANSHMPKTKVSLVTSQHGDFRNEANWVSKPKWSHQLPSSKKTVRINFLLEESTDFCPATVQKLDTTVSHGGTTSRNPLAVTNIHASELLKDDDSMILGISWFGKSWGCKKKIWGPCPMTPAFNPGFQVECLIIQLLSRSAFVLTWFTFWNEWLVNVARGCSWYLWTLLGWGPWWLLCHIDDLCDKSQKPQMMRHKLCNNEACGM